MERTVLAPPNGSNIEVSSDDAIHIVQMEEGIAEHRVILVSEEQARELCAAIYDVAEELGWEL